VVIIFTIKIYEQTLRAASFN